MATDTKGQPAEPRFAAQNLPPQTGDSKPAGTRQSATGDRESADERRRKIAEAAYYRAERRGFAAGYEDADWLEAERETDSGRDRVSRNREADTNIDVLNKCLRSELSAIETYRQALEKHRQQYAHDTKFQQLTQMLKDHRDAASRLQALIQQKGGIPSNDSGAWGIWSKTVMGTAKLFGDKAALKALKEGEESGMKEYQGIAQDPAASADVKSATSPLMARQQDHIRQLDRLIEAA